MAGEVARLTARVHKNPSDTTGYFSYNNNTYRYKYPAKGPHSYELATAQGDVDWKEIDRNSAAYQTLESKAPLAVKAEVEKPSLFELIKRKFTPNKREFGGPMSYSSYLLSGGILDQAPKELVELVIKALEGDQESGKSLSALIQENPEAEGIVQQIAEALTSDSSPAAMKCGGRVLKAEGGDRVNLPSIKTRKLEGKELSFVESTSAGKTRIDEYKDKEGNKYRYAEFTDHKGDVHKEYIFNGKKHKSGELHEEDMKKFTKPTKKAERGLKIGASKCGCTLKKVGGRLIEVDGCTGLPVHRTGAAIKKYKNPHGSLTLMSNSDAMTNASTSTQKLTTPLNVYVGYGSNTISTNPNHSYVGEKGNFGNLGDYQYYIDRDGRNILYAMGKDGKYYMGKKGFWANLTGIGGDNFNNWTELTGDQITDEIKGYFKTKADADAAAKAKAAADAAAKAKADADASKPQYNTYGQVLQPNGTYAGVTYGQRNAAAAGMLGADGKTGMTVDERRVWMNGAGKDYLASLNGGNGLGFSAADYTGTAAQNRALFNAYKGFGAWVRPTDYTNQLLLDMTDELAAAAGLSAGDIARRTKLKNYQTARNTALTFNGLQYADEAAYNSAVDAYNQNLTNKYTADRKAALDKYMANRALATTAGTLGIAARRLAAFDNWAKFHEGTLKDSDLSRRDIRDMQRLYRRGKNAGYYTAATAKDFYANQNGIVKPELAQKFNGNAVLTDELLNATEFKRGGQLNYANYLN